VAGLAGTTKLVSIIGIDPIQVDAKLRAASTREKPAKEKKAKQAKAKAKLKSKSSGKK